MIVHIDRKTLGALLFAGCLLAGPNRRAFDHIGNFNFKVEIEGVTCGSFRNVEGLESETEMIEVREAALGERILGKTPGKTSYSNIVLRAGSIHRELFREWRSSVLSGKPARKNGSVILCGDDGAAIARYNFFECFPIRWEGWTLDAKGTDVLIEKIELAVEKIERA